MTAQASLPLQIHKLQLNCFFPPTVCSVRSQTQRDSKLTKSTAALQTYRQIDETLRVMSSSFHGNSEVKPGRLWLAGRPGRVVPCRRVWRGSPGHWCHQRYWNQDQGSSLFLHTTRERGVEEIDRQKNKKKRKKDKWKWNTKILTIYTSIE